MKLTSKSIQESKSEEDLALLKAISEKNIPDLVDTLKKGANPNTLSDNGLTPLMTLVSEPFNDTIRKMCTHLLAKNANPNIGTLNGVTPLHLVAQLGDERLTRMLCISKANVNAARKDTGETPLICALNGNHDKVIAVLKEYGAILPKSKPIQKVNQTTPKPVTSPQKKPYQMREDYRGEAFERCFWYSHRLLEPKNKNAKNNIKVIWEELKAKKAKGRLFTTTNIDSDEDNPMLPKAAALMERLLLNLDVKGVMELDKLLDDESEFLWSHFSSQEPLYMAFFDSYIISDKEPIPRGKLYNDNDYRPYFYRSNPEARNFTPKNPRAKKANEKAYQTLSQYVTEKWKSFKELKENETTYYSEKLVK